MKTVILIFASLAFSVAAADDHENGGKVAPLFQSNDILEATLTAPIEQIMRERSDEEELPGTFTYRDAETGAEVEVSVAVRTRGRFRRKKETCRFAPLRLNFSKKKGTLLAKSDKLKLVTHCRTGSTRYEQALLKEYLAYRILNAVTDWSFRVRLLRITYVESTDGEEIVETYGILIEHRDQLAKRIGMKVDRSESTTIPALDGAHTNIVSVYQYLIGNTDFSAIKGVPGEPCCHNHVLMGNDSIQISVPYDFDVSGIVNPPHGAPNPRFKLSSLRERLYRGRCYNARHLESTLQLYRDKRDDIYALIENLDGFSAAESKRTQRYIEDFYKVIDTPRKKNLKLVRGCLGPANPAPSSPR